MIRRITLDNYMSHAHTVIEPADGLTVLVGPNNCGKSAVVSALETLCNNASGAYMVRHDEKVAMVTIETDDGHTFAWKRKGNVVSYVIDDRPIHRVRGGVPEDLHKLLRLPKVDAGETGEPFDIHFGTQKSPIFLLNEPESRAALFFASSSDAAILLEMQKRHRGKVKDRKNDEKRLKGEIQKLDVELGALEPVQALEIALSQADQQYQELLELADLIKALTRETEALHTHWVKHDRLMRASQLLAPLKPVPQLGDTSSLKSLIVALIEAQRDLQKDRARSNALETLKSTPELADVPSLARTAGALDRAQNDQYRWFRRSKAVKALRSPPEFGDSESLQSLCRALSHEETNHNILEAKTDRLSLLREPPVMAEAGQLNSTVLALESAQATNGVLGRQQRALRNLAFPPELKETKTIAELVNNLARSQRTISSLIEVIIATTLDLQKAETAIAVSERAVFDSDTSGQTARRLRTSMLLALSSLAGVAVVILLIVFGPGWFGRFNARSSSQEVNPLGLSANAKAKATDKRDEPPPPIGRQPAQKETPKDELANGETKTEPPNRDDRRKDDFRKGLPKDDDSRKDSITNDKTMKGPPKQDNPNKDEPKNNEPGKGQQKKDVIRIDESTKVPPKHDNSRKDEPKNDEPRNGPLKHDKGSKDGNMKEEAKQEYARAKQGRLKHIRQLLDDAEMANEKGMYLDAVLGFGQAAILYPDELTEVERPERLRMKFLEALRRYQAQVEQAFEKAGKKGADDE